jgi:hypothetical protein
VEDEQVAVVVVVVDKFDSYLFAVVLLLVELDEHDYYHEKVFV